MNKSFLSEVRRQLSTKADKAAFAQARMDYLRGIGEQQLNDDVRVVLDPTYTGHETKALGSSWVYDAIAKEVEVQACIDAAIEGGRKVHVTYADTAFEVSDKNDVVGFDASRSFNATQDSEQPRDRDHGTLIYNGEFGPEGLLRQAAEAGIATFGLVKIMRYSGTGYGSEIDDGLRQVLEIELPEDALHIISMSFGGSSPGNYDQIFEPYAGKPIILIAAAGNSGGDKDEDNISWPAKSEYVLCIAATASNGHRANFSSTGPALNLSAPGQNTPSYDLNGRTISWSGTSRSCPVQASAIALLYLENGLLSHQEIVKEFLQAFATDKGEDGHDWLYGYGSTPLRNYLSESPIDEEPEGPQEPDQVTFNLTFNGVANKREDGNWHLEIES